MPNNIDSSITFGPVSGECFICGKRLEAYWNKMLNLKDGRMVCEEHNTVDRHPSLREQGFVSYSDG
ncbi:MAG: hypothetical protein NUV75_01910 [Gallionella sp.]|nr:hypothetical protein [Gallionella sp.]